MAVRSMHAGVFTAPGHAVLGRESAAFELNRILRDFVARHPGRCGLLDFERIAARLGEAGTLDRRFGLMMKAPFKEGAKVPLYLLSVGPRRSETIVLHNPFVGRAAAPWPRPSAGRATTPTRTRGTWSTAAYW